jgi:hypothetical protein
MKKIMIVVCIMLCIVACTYKKAPVVPVTPVAGCDTIHITYKKDIQPIFSAHCYSCHATAVTTSGGLNLEDTASLKFYLHNGFRGDNIYGSKLFHCMLHSSSALPMPPTYVVDTCSLNKMHHWLAIGAPL